MMPHSEIHATIAWVMIGHEDYGVRRAVLNLASAMASRGCHVHLIALDRCIFTDAAQRAGLTVHEMGLGILPAYEGGMLRRAVSHLTRRRYEKHAANRLAQLLQKIGADLAQFLAPTLTGIVGSAAQSLDLPCVWEMPNVISAKYPLGINRRIYHHRCRRYDITVLANSQYTASTFGPGPVTPHVCHLGVDTAHFDPAAVKSFDRAQRGIGSDDLVVVCVARLTEQKGQRVLWQAIEKLSPDAPPIHALFVGGPIHSPYAQQLNDSARRAGLAHRLHLIDSVDDPRPYIAGADFAVNCRLDAEPFGLSVIEAMAMGKPVLVHAWGGPAETVIDAVTGWHVHAPTLDAFAGGLKRAISDRSRWIEMGRAARQLVLERFSTEAQVSRYIKIVGPKIKHK